MYSPIPLWPRTEDIYHFWLHAFLRTLDFDFQLSVSYFSSDFWPTYHLLPFLKTSLKIVPGQGLHAVEVCISTDLRLLTFWPKFRLVVSSLKRLLFKKKRAMQVAIYILVYKSMNWKLHYPSYKSNSQNHTCLHMTNTLEELF